MYLIDFKKYCINHVDDTRSNITTNLSNSYPKDVLLLDKSDGNITNQRASMLKLDTSAFIQTLSGTRSGSQIQKINECNKVQKYF